MLQKQTRPTQWLRINKIKYSLNTSFFNSLENPRLLLFFLIFLKTLLHNGASHKFGLQNCHKSPSMPYCSPQWSILFSVTLLLFVLLLLLLHFLLLKFGKSGGSVLAVNQTATKALITEAFHVERSNKHKLLGGTRVGVGEKEGRKGGKQPMSHLILWYQCQTCSLFF